jgi:molybdopterin synthase catalytic subunit
MSGPALTTAPIDIAALASMVADPEHGGLATFLGMTRREADRRAYRAIEYVAYDALAEREIAAIGREAEVRFGACVRIRHRTGIVPVGEASVGIAASAAHRADAFAACRYAIDALKLRVPIWKRAHFADGAVAWFDDIAPGHGTTDPSGATDA